MKWTIKTFNQLLSRYRPLYVRSLIYMLQSSEYDIGDYLAWYSRTADFRSVERRKTLVRTHKVRLLYACAYSIVFAIAVFSYLATAFAEFYPRLIIIACSLLLLPYALAYVILIPLTLINILQIPVEYVLIRRARIRLARHKGLKIAIAGSYGKTSMKEVLKTVLGEGKKVASPSHSHNTPIGICRFIFSLSGNEEVLIFELGEYYPGDVRKLCRIINPHIGIITGVNEAHLEKFGTLEKTARTIFELAEYLKERPVYINGENELARKNAKTELKNHILYSRDGAGDCRIKNQKSDLSGTSFSLLIDDLKFTVRSKLLGLHNIGPLAVSAHIAYRLGFSRLQISAGIAKTRAFSHRLEPREDEAGVITLDDSYNGNPDGVNAIIDFLSSLKGHRRWYVTPGLVEMGSKTAEVHREIGMKIAMARLEKVVLVKNSVTSYIEQGLRDAHYAGEILWFDDSLMAYSSLPRITSKGDVVLLQNDWPDQYA
jgi:UDP-N-acetylmuramoyl-tripeptide--D-alanyl-D-alanine ligase